MSKLKTNDTALQLQICLLLSVIGLCLGALDEALHHYETLHVNDIHHRISKRSVDGTKHISFQALGRKFNLFLQVRKGLLSSNFKAVSVNGKGVEKPIAVDESSFYTGYDEDESHSKVQAYWEGDALSATIRTPKDVFVVEPSWRHLPTSDNFSMIAYKGSDVKSKFEKDHPSHEGPSFCGSVRQAASNNTPKVSDSLGDDTTTDGNQGNRKKRDAFDQSKNSCPLLLVGDYQFFKNMGQSNLASATNYLIGLIDRVDAIYRNTEFEPGLKNFGFEVKEIKIHNEWSVTTTQNPVHYNMETSGWQTKDLLEAFSTLDHTGLCLSHLFTAQAVGKTTATSALGLSYIASIRDDVAGGICSRAYYQDATPMYLNTGWSSSLNRAGRRILTSEADIVTTHEFGHNWGSEHDPDTDECSPNSYNGGKYIMYTYSVSGYEDNNKVFSKCSRRSMAQVLKAKSSKCFIETVTKGFCGNAKIEEGEECDGGLEGQEGNDPCCTPDCRLYQSAMCSDINQKCCRNCQYAPPTEVCYQALESDLACEGNATCTGTGPDCPKPSPKPDDTDCFENGTCKNGVCQPFCEKKDKLSCICDNVTLSCVYCCRDTVKSDCKPYPSNDPDHPHYFLPDGKPCLQGVCNNTGVCEKQTVDLVQRLWDVITDISFSDIVAFMRANIVGTIIVFSLLIWIPAGCVISHVDRKKQRQERENRDWLKPDNTSLIHSEKRMIDLTTGTRRRPIVDTTRHSTTV